MAKNINHKKGAGLPLYFIVVAILLVVIGLFIGFTPLQQSLKKFFSSPTPTPTPLSKYRYYSIPVPLPTGKQTYNVSQEATSGPRISQVTIDNFDPKKGERQQFLIKISSKSPIAKVQITLITDYQTKTYPAVFKEGKQTDGIWEAVVSAEDSHDYVYQAIVEAVDSKERSSVTLTIR